MVITLVVAVTGIVVSNLSFMGASGRVNGAGSSIASKIAWTVGAAAAVGFVVLSVRALVARRHAATRA
ncbi:MAG TPA: hypothetical protein VGR41_09440 [Actinomycetota bacterium]|jgi:hypothetical protein|nr:hypothetical protein [Actinomycetota bacterium]